MHLVGTSGGSGEERHLGDKGPYRQSERMEQGIYQELAEQLMAAGHAYRCFCTQEELDAKRAKAEAEGGNPQYDGTWRDAHPAADDGGGSGSGGGGGG